MYDVKWILINCCAVKGKYLEQPEVKKKEIQQHGSSMYPALCSGLLAQSFSESISVCQGCLRDQPWLSSGIVDTQTTHMVHVTILQPARYRVSLTTWVTPAPVSVRLWHCWHRWYCLHWFKRYVDGWWWSAMSALSRSFFAAASAFQEATKSCSTICCAMPCWRLSSTRLNAKEETRFGKCDLDIDGNVSFLEQCVCYFTKKIIIKRILVLGKIVHSGFDRPEQEQLVWVTITFHPSTQ